VAEAVQTTVRRATADDVRLLAEREPQTALLDDERTIFLVAEQAGEVVGFAFGYVLPRRHGFRTGLFVYEIEVGEPYRRQGIARQLMETLLAGQEEGYVFTEPGNDAANALYASLGGKRSDVVMWDFEAR
jgi:ribosomal protein S18 acetylase RimI-like enzyme